MQVAQSPSDHHHQIHYHQTLRDHVLLIAVVRLLEYIDYALYQSVKHWYYSDRTVSFINLRTVVPTLLTSSLNLPLRSASSEICNDGTEICMYMNTVYECNFHLH